MKIFHAIKESGVDGVSVNITGNSIELTSHHFDGKVKGEPAGVFEILKEDGSKELIEKPAIEEVAFNTSMIGAHEIYSKTQSVDFSELMSRPDAESGACWNVYFAKNSKKLVVINSNALSQPIRGNVHEAFKASVQEVPVMVIAVPRLDATISEAYIGVNTCGDANATVTSSETVLPVPDGFDLDYVRNLARPKFSIIGQSTIAEGQTDEFTISALNFEGSIDQKFNDHFYAETTGGILAVSKVKAVNGVAKLRLVGAHLIAGDTITIKVGTKFYTSLAKIDVTVTML